MLTKQAIRSKILIQLKTQKEEDRNSKSRVIKDRLFRRKEFIHAKVLMFYVALKDEVNTQGMIEEAKRLGKIIAVPVCRDKTTIQPCILDDHAALREGPYGVREPAQAEYLRLEDLDLVVVPGLAFDEKGNRLGRGKGYYDRFLSRLYSHTTSIGIAFDFQILPEIPVQPHDIAVQQLLFA